MFLRRTLAHNVPKQMTTMQKRFMGHVEDPVEAAKGVKVWARVSIGASVFVAAYAFYALMDQDHGYRTERPYTHLRNHRFPWSDGERELFGLVGNKVFGIYYPQYEPSGVDQGVPKPKDDHGHH